MATLEVHDGEGRVQFVELAHDHPVIFGTSVACDIVLSGEGISPVQGRIRWKKGTVPGRGLAGCRVRRDQRPQDDVVQPESGRRDDRRSLPAVHAPTGRGARSQADRPKGKTPRRGTNASSGRTGAPSFWFGSGAAPPLEESPRPDRQALRRGPRSRPSNATIGCKISA